MRRAVLFLVSLACVVALGCSSSSSDGPVDERLAISATIYKASLPSLDCELEYTVIMYQGSNVVTGADVRVTGQHSTQTLDEYYPGQYAATITSDISLEYVAGQTFEISITVDGVEHVATVTAPGGSFGLTADATEASWGVEGNRDQITIRQNNPVTGSQTLGPDLTSPTLMPTSSYSAGEGNYSVYVEPTNILVNCFSGDCHPTSYVLIRDTMIYHNVP